MEGHGVIVIRTKVCPSCGQEKTIEGWHFHLKTADRLQWQCRSCFKANRRAKTLAEQMLLNVRSSAHQLRRRGGDLGVIEIDKDFIDRLLRTQKRCALTNVEFDLTKNSMFMPSLDRICSDIGYVPGNVQLVTVGANYAKNRYSQEEALRWIQAVRDAKG